MIRKPCHHVMSGIQKRCMADRMFHPEENGDQGLTVFQDLFWKKPLINHIVPHFWLIVPQRRSRRKTNQIPQTGRRIPTRLPIVKYNGQNRRQAIGGLPCTFRHQLLIKQARVNIHTEYHPCVYLGLKLQNQQHKETTSGANGNLPHHISPSSLSLRGSELGVQPFHL